MTTYVLKAYRGKKILSHHGTVEEAATHFTELQNAGINPILHRADGLTLTNEESLALIDAGVKDGGALLRPVAFTHAAQDFLTGRGPEKGAFLTTRFRVGVRI